MMSFSPQFERAVITQAALKRAISAYQNDRNGKFYNRTYDDIVDIFSELSIPLRVALTMSWMHGNYKPNLDNADALKLYAKFATIDKINRNNISRIRSSYSQVEKELRSVAASKYLHFSAPNTFVMWDYKIQRFVFGDKLPTTGNSEAYAKYVLALKEKYHSAKINKLRFKSFPIPRLLDLWLWDESKK